MLNERNDSGSFRILRYVEFLECATKLPKQLISRERCENEARTSKQLPGMRETPQVCYDSPESLASPLNENTSTHPEKGTLSKKIPIFCHVLQGQATRALSFCLVCSAVLSFYWFLFMILVLCVFRWLLLMLTLFGFQTLCASMFARRVFPLMCACGLLVLFLLKLQADSVTLVSEGSSCSCDVTFKACPAKPHGPHLDRTGVAKAAQYHTASQAHFRPD